MEIERRFLVRGEPWRGLTGEPLVQGYLATDGGVAVRVRLVGDRAVLTIKGPSGPGGLTRAEFEYDVPVEDARGMLALCRGRVICKTRYAVRVGRHAWDLDVFEDANAGLVLAEVELAAEDEDFERPDWLGAEVTGDPRYTNAALATRPYAAWTKHP